MQKNLLAVILFSFLFCVGFSQSLKSSLLEKAIEEKKLGQPVLLLIYPEDNFKTDALYTRYGGAVEPETQVSLNGLSLKVYPTGAFAGRVKIDVRKNTLCFIAKSAEGTTSKTVTVTRSLPPKALSPLPLKIETDKFMEPKGDILLQPGDIFKVRFKGSKNQKALFRVGDRNIKYPMFEKKENPGGIYEGSYKIKPTDIYVDARVTFYLYNKSGGKPKYVKTLAPAKITVDRSGIPKYYFVKNKMTKFYPTLQNSSYLFSLFPDSLLYATGQIGSKIRISLSPSFTGWVDKKDVKEAKNISFANISVASPSYFGNEKHTFVSISFPYRLPVRAVYNNAEKTLLLDIFGAHPEAQWINKKIENTLIDELYVSLVEDRRTQVKIHLKENILGYRLYYKKNTLFVELKSESLTKKAGEKRLENLTFLLDPGHGGFDKGAIGNTGLYEKDVNLFFSNKLKKELESLGAVVKLSRTADEDISVKERIDFINKNDCVLTLSIHHNSIGLKTDPLKVKGISTFYHHSYSSSLAKILYKKILFRCPELYPYGIIQSDHTLLREVTASRCVLIEGLFMSNPTDEMLLMDDEYCDRFTKAVVEAVVEYVNTIRCQE